MPLKDTVKDTPHTPMAGGSSVGSAEGGGVRVAVVAGSGDWDGLTNMTAADVVAVEPIGDAASEPDTGADVLVELAGAPGDALTGVPDGVLTAGSEALARRDAAADAASELAEEPTGVLATLPAGVPADVLAGELARVPAGVLAGVPAGELARVLAGVLAGVPAGDRAGVPDGLAGGTGVVTTKSVVMLAHTPS